jgi:hypothetical protein
LYLLRGRYRPLRKQKGIIHPKGKNMEEKSRLVPQKRRLRKRKDELFVNFKTILDKDIYI